MVDRISARKALAQRVANAFCEKNFVTLKQSGCDEDGILLAYKNEIDAYPKSIHPPQVPKEYDFSIIESAVDNETNIEFNFFDANNNETDLQLRLSIDGPDEKPEVTYFDILVP